MSRRNKAMRYHDALIEHEWMQRFRKEEYGPVPPRPGDLTVDIITERMSRIFVGDKIKFDSYKECFTASQVDRHNSTIKAIGTVVEHCGGYLMVQLRRGLLESVNYFDIESVNGHSFPGYIPRYGQTDIVVNEAELWK